MKIGAPPAHPRPALYLGACAGLLAFSGMLVASASSLGVAIPWYLPLSRTWAFATLPPGPGIAMDYYGRVALALAVGVVAAVVAGIALRGRAIPAALLRAAGVWAIGLTLLGMAWYAWAFAHRAVAPPSDLPAASDSDSD